jgi:SpoVK/Ycf46/Vps4 family AAA+-type ATPase
LQSIVTRFNSCSGIYDELDIPHKLGILLYGEPGTGKSSTIKAIASHTGRDIYYVDLSNIKRNSELKMIFDHVNKGCVKGGVLVFEDIDCMTDMVKPRENSHLVLPRENSHLVLPRENSHLVLPRENSHLVLPRENSEYHVIERKKEDNMLAVVGSGDENMSLSYFLNLLDGTLSADNLLFIMTTNHIENLDPALVRNGRVDVSIELKCCDRYQIASIYNKITKNKLPKNILDKIPEYKFKPIDIITHILKFYVCGKNHDTMMEKFYEK